MRTVRTFIRVLGLLGGLWLLYAVISTQVHLYALVPAGESAENVAPGVRAIANRNLWMVTLPTCVIAGLIFLPYTRLPKAARLAGAGGIAVLGLFLFTQFFAPYFFSARFVPQVIPPAIWVAVAVFNGFLLLQIMAIALTPLVTRTRAT